MLRDLLKTLYNQYIAPEVGVKSVVGASMLVIGAVIYLININVYHYQGEMQFGWVFLKYLPVYILLYVMSLYIRMEYPRIALFFNTLGQLSFVAVVTQFLLTMVQYTPFDLYDSLLHRLDLMLGYHGDVVFAWSQAHPGFFWFFNFMYSKLYLELLLTPLLLALFIQRRQVDVFLLACLIASLLGFVIYYFFPTTNPAAVMTGVHFFPVQYHEVSQFMQLHSHQRITHYVGGIIGFPSFHVIWAILLTLAYQKNKVLFFFSIIFNSLIVVSTLVLNWHYLMDVIGGVIVAWFAWAMAQRYSSVHDFQKLSVISFPKVPFISSIIAVLVKQR